MINKIQLVKRTIFHYLSYLFPILLYKRKGDLGHDLKVVLTKGVKILNTNKVNYSYGALYKLFELFFLKLKSDVPDFNPKNILMLGMGAGSVIRLIKKHYPSALITVVEKDMVVIEISHRKFGLNKEFKFNLHYADAYEFVEKQDEIFDFIINDVFVDDEVPSNLKSLKYLECLKSICSDQGIVAFNKMESVNTGRLSLEVFRFLFEKVFPNSDSFEMENLGRKNHVFYAKVNKS